MKIEINKFKGYFDKNECYVHARACALDENNIIMTMQKLNIKGCDDFSPLVVMKSKDCGKSWSEPSADSAFITEYDKNGIRTLGCDATHIFHKKTNTPIVAGHLISYKKDSAAPVSNSKKFTFYSTYDLKAQKFTPVQVIDVPFDVYPRGCATGCSQFIEKENGDILLPVTIMHDERFHMATAIMCCSFDGKKLIFKEMGNELNIELERGLCEGSICKFKNKYYLTIRNDCYGFYSVSDNGLHFSKPEIWKWDTEEILPNYNTQQHWLECGGKLYLVYTRKAGNNDHVFRHRAPLFMAEVDTDSMRILRHTEQIVVPERGARLGNFGVTQINKNKAIITVTEWMQPEGCEKYGSDNSIFVTTVEA